MKSPLEIRISESKIRDTTKSNHSSTTPPLYNCGDTHDNSDNDDGDEEAEEISLEDLFARANAILVRHRTMNDLEREDVAPVLSMLASGKRKMENNIINKQEFQIMLNTAEDYELISKAEQGTASAASPDNKSCSGSGNTVDFTSRRLLHRNSAIMTTAKMWEEEQQRNNNQKMDSTNTTLNSDHDPYLPIVRRRSHEMLQEGHLSKHAMPSRRSVLNVAEETMYPFIEANLGKLIGYDDCAQLPLQGVSPMTKVAEKKKKRSTATDSRGGSFKGHRESRTNAQSRRGRKTGRSSVMGSMLRGIRRSIAWVDFKSTKDNAAGNDPHDGEKEDDSFWFKTHWQSVVEEWMTCVTSRPSEEIDTKVLQSLFIEINFSKIGVDGDDNVSEELGGGSLESGAAVSCLRQLCAVLAYSCLHETRKWSLEYHHHHHQQPMEEEEEEEEEEKKKASSVVNMKWCGKCLRLLNMISTVLLLTSPATMHKTGSNKSSSNKSGNKNIKYPEIMLTDKHALFDVASVVLHCVRHLIRRALPSLIRSVAPASSMTSFWSGRLRDLCHSDAWHTKLSTLSTQFDNVDGAKEEAEEEREETTSALDTLSYTLFRTVASMDPALQSAEKRLDMIICAERERLQEQNDADEEERTRVEMEGRKRSSFALEEPRVAPLHVVSVSAALPPPPPPAESLPSNPNTFVTGMSMQEVVWWTNLLQIVTT